VRVSVIVRIWFRLPPKSLALFALAALLVCGGACVLGEGLYFRGRAIRVEGTVVGEDRGGPQAHGHRSAYSPVRG
jgi:hypothetical protein